MEKTLVYVDSKALGYRINSGHLIGWYLLMDPVTEKELDIFPSLFSLERYVIYVLWA